MFPAESLRCFGLGKMSLGGWDPGGEQWAGQAYTLSPGMRLYGWGGW